jgi:microsomal epoxide hydrolase
MQRNKTLLFAALFLMLIVHADCGKPSAAGSIQDGYVTIGSGIRIHYLEAGSGGSAPALVFIPGWRLPAYLWTEQLKTFSHMTHVLAIDPRSQGESTKTTQGNSPESRAADLHDVLGRLRVSRPVLVGWSQGAQDVAAYVAKFGSESIAGIVLVDSPVSIGSNEIEAHREFSKTILSGLRTYAEYPEEYSKGMVQSLFKQPHPDLDMHTLVESTLKTPTDIGIAMLVMDIFGADRSGPLRQFKAPALVIAASESPLFDLERDMASNIPGAMFVPIDNAGHAVFVDQPEKFDNALNQFLKSLVNN